MVWILQWLMVDGKATRTTGMIALRPMTCCPFPRVCWVLGAPFFRMMVDVKFAGRELSVVVTPTLARMLRIIRKEMMRMTHRAG